MKKQPSGTLKKGVARDTKSPRIKAETVHLVSVTVQPINEGGISKTWT